jgi:hypothetical protein
MPNFPPDSVNQGHETDHGGHLEHMLTCLVSHKSYCLIHQFFAVEEALKFQASFCKLLRSHEMSAQSSMALFSQ